MKPRSLFVFSAAVSALFVASHDRATAESVESSASGPWSNPATWTGHRVPQAGDDVTVNGGDRVVYDVESDAVLRTVRVAGILSFARDRDTSLSAARIVVDPSATGASGAAVDDVAKHGSHGKAGDGHGGSMPPHRAALEIGSPDAPIPPSVTARVRLHFLEGMDPEQDPAIVCRPGGRFDVHGAPMTRTWVKLGANAMPGETSVTLAEAVDGWKAGDEVVVTGGPRSEERGEEAAETRTITAIAGLSVTLDRPLKKEHWGEGDFRSEIANLSRSAVIESAEPEGVRGHTMHHWGSAGSISYARFAHLGKRGVLGRYPIHFHLVEDSMRGSSVIGAAIVDSHNRWITVHGTQYMVVRDCVGYKSVGHGYFLEDATEVYNLLDRNLAIGAAHGPRMKEQALPFDPNDGAGFWWANGKNTFTRNVATENEEYGYRYDCQMSRSFDCTLPVRQADGSYRDVDVRTIPIWRFEDNEAHTEGFYGMVVAANGNSQPDAPIRDGDMLDRIRSIDWTGPDSAHPHLIRGLSIWNAHHALRPHSPNMLMENIRIHKAAYGIYRPAFENHVYRDLHISSIGAEPFNRGMDDASAQTGKVTVDGLTFEHGHGSSSTPLIQISDNNLSGDAETHIRRLNVIRPEQFADRWPLINRGVGPRVAPVSPGVPIVVHDWFAPGEHAMVVSAAAEDLLGDGSGYDHVPGLTGDEARARKVRDPIAWPELLDVVDDEPPATMILSARTDGDTVTVSGISHDNGEIASVTVNDRKADIVSQHAGVADWTVTLPAPAIRSVRAAATDAAGNTELTSHHLAL